MEFHTMSDDEGYADLDFEKDDDLEEDFEFDEDD